MNYKKILYGLSIVCWLVFIYAIIYDMSGWYFLFFLGGILFGNLGGSLSEMVEWNKGICRKTNKPWDYKENDMLSDESMIYVFKSGKECYVSQYMRLEKLKKQYKGSNKFE